VLAGLTLIAPVAVLTIFLMGIVYCLMVRSGELPLIDVAFVQVRPSPWPKRSTWAT
jgi:hypothetical protein